MTVIGDAFVRVRPDMDGFENETKRGIGGALKGVAAAGVAALAVAGTAATAFGVKSVMAASDLGESISKVNVVFGDSAQAILDWGATTEGTLLLSKQQALDSAGTFGNLFTSFGMSSEGAGAMSTSLVELAQDLSSFNNIPVEEALDALRAGMTGETEPLKRLGAAFSAAELEAKAMSMGLVEQGGELNNAAKAQAAYALIMERTTNAQGDAARTAGGMANQLKILKANALDTMANVGEALLPMATQLVTTMGGLFSQVAPILADLAAQVAPLLEDVSVLLAGLVERIGPSLGQVFGVLASVLEAVPWDMVVVAVGNIMDAVLALLPPLQAALTPVLQAIGILLPPISAVFTLIAETLAAILMPVVEALAPVLVQLATVIDSQLNAVLEQLFPVLQEVGAQLGTVVAEAVIALAPLFMQLVEALLPLLPPLLDLITALLPVLVQLLSTVIPLFVQVQSTIIKVITMALVPIVDAIADVITWVADVITAFGEWWGTLDQFWLDVSTFVDQVLGAFEDLAVDIVGAVEGFVGDVAGIAEGIWLAFKDVFSRVAGAWNSTVGSLSFTIPSWVPGLGGNGFNVPDIPSFATGAIVYDPTMAVIGDRPEGEAVLTRPQLRDVLDWAGAAGGGGKGITFNGPVTFGADMASATQELDWVARYSMGAAAA